MGAFSFNNLTKCWLAVALSLLGIQAAHSDDSLTVTCTNNGSGLYSYTFSRGTEYYFWGVLTGSAIQLRSYGVLQTFQPEGWSGSVDTNGVVAWQYTNGVGYLDVPTTFSILSSYAMPTAYEDWLPLGTPFGRGIISGGVFTARNDDPFEGGYVTFPYVGPNPNPIPTLSLQKIGTDIVVSWPAAITGFVLESSTDASQAASWVQVTNVPGTVGNQFYVTNSIVDGPTFFRLKK
jgi:hypothetical protein